MEGVVILTVLAVITVALLFLSLVGRRRQGIRGGRYRRNWAAIRDDLKDPNPKIVVQGILAADKLVDEILVARGMKGEQMSDRIKAAKKVLRYDDYNRLWAVHKLRNRIAHEPDFKFNRIEANVAVRDLDKLIRALLG